MMLSSTAPLLLFSSVNLSDPVSLSSERDSSFKPCMSSFSNNELFTTIQELL